MIFDSNSFVCENWHKINNNLALSEKKIEISQKRVDKPKNNCINNNVMIKYSTQERKGQNVEDIFFEGIKETYGGSKYYSEKK